MDFQVRHLALFPTQGRSVLKTLITKSVVSHAMTGVKTSRGWMLVDSNSAWMAVDRYGNPIDGEDIALGRASLLPQPKDLGSFFDKPFVMVYGLYSRHGRFYPPYVPLPDVNWVDFVRFLPADHKTVAHYHEGWPYQTAEERKAESDRLAATRRPSLR